MPFQAFEFHGLQKTKSFWVSLFKHVITFYEAIFMLS